MSVGPGKYGDLCTLVREEAMAEGAIVIVLGGKLGNGFSMQLMPEVMVDLAAMLESMAAQIRKDQIAA